MVLQRKGKATKSAPYLRSISRRTHRVYGIPKIMLEFVKIQLAKTNPELREIGKTSWVRKVLCRGPFPKAAKLAEAISNVCLIYLPKAMAHTCYVFFVILGKQSF